MLSVILNTINEIIDTEKKVTVKVTQKVTVNQKKIIEAIRKKPIKQEIELKIQLLGFIVLILLSIYITYNDVLRIL